MRYDFVPNHRQEGIYFIGWSERRETGRWSKAFYRPLRRCWWLFLRVAGRIKRLGPFRTVEEAKHRADE